MWDRQAPPLCPAVPQQSVCLASSIHSCFLFCESGRQQDLSLRDCAEMEAGDDFIQLLPKSVLTGSWHHRGPRSEMQMFPPGRWVS